MDETFILAVRKLAQNISTLYNIINTSMFVEFNNGFGAGVGMVRNTGLYIITTILNPVGVVVTEDFVQDTEEWLTPAEAVSILDRVGQMEVE